jgi:predicted tellurium resistance membrane protein TerC
VRFTWITLLTLTRFLEIVLGIDYYFYFDCNGKLPAESRKKAKIGMFLAMFMRITATWDLVLDSHEKSLGLQSILVG